MTHAAPVSSSQDGRSSALCRASGSPLVAVLCVSALSIYKGLPGVECYDPKRDVRTFAGGMPVVAHPPCRSWSALLRAPGETAARGEGAGAALRRVDALLWGRAGTPCTLAPVRLLRAPEAWPINRRPLDRRSPASLVGRHPHENDLALLLANRPPGGPLPLRAPLTERRPPPLASDEQNPTLCDASRDGRLARGDRSFGEPLISPFYP